MLLVTLNISPVNNYNKANVKIYKTKMKILLLSSDNIKGPINVFKNKKKIML